MNCDGHWQTENAKGEGPWQVLPCDYKSAMVKVEKKILIAMISSLTFLFFEIEI